MYNDKHIEYVENCDSSEKLKKYFYDVDDFPKFKILEQNYHGILNELLVVINSQKLDNSLNITINNSFNNYENYGFSAWSENSEKQIPQCQYLHFQNKRISDTDNTNSDSNTIKDKSNSNHVDSINNTNGYNTHNSSIINKNDNDVENTHIKYDKIIHQSEEKYVDKFYKADTINEGKLFEPWVEKNLYQDSNEEGWDVAPLMIGGVKIPERCKKFPFLCKLVDQIPGVISVSFSRLKPGTHIVPHKGYDDYSEKMFRYHMGIMVPEGDVAIRVEKEIRKWENAKSFIFDDFLVHEAWNFTCKNRIVLIIDFLKNDNIFPEGIQFSDANFNKSIKGYFNNLNPNSLSEGHNNDKDVFDDIDEIYND